ncbi:MAG: TetR/AcrR family transcriptional regulator [bacterium]|nr:TetR/AcrR family transcriptional regulator [bacterium]
MNTLSPKQQEILERDALILDVSRELLLKRGYYGLTMDRIAAEADCPKGTMYQRFRCKEDIVLALALESFKRRSDMMRRAVTFKGSARERVLALGEAASLFSRLSPDDSRIMHTSTGPIREKASAERVAALIEMEKDGVGILKNVLLEAVRNGNLPLRHDTMVEEMTFAIWALVDGSYTLIESGIPYNALGITDPFSRLFIAFNVFADGYGWRPLFHELDWEETLAQVRRTVFPEEAQRLYGEGQWYGDGA